MAPFERDDDGAGITEDAPEAALGNKAVQAIQVVEELELDHRQSMTKIPQEEKSFFPRKSRGSSGRKPVNYPLESRKSLSSLNPLNCRSFPVENICAFVLYLLSFLNLKLKDCRFGQNSI